MISDDQFRTLMVLGFLFRRLGLDDKAWRLYEALSALRPDDPSLLAPAAAAALGTERPREALERLDRLAGSQAPEAAHWLMRAQALSALGREGEAREAAKRCLGAAPPSEAS